MARKTIKGLEAELREQKQQKYEVCKEKAELRLKLDSAMLGEKSYVNRIEILTREVQSLSDKLAGLEWARKNQQEVIKEMEDSRARGQAAWEARLREEQMKRSAADQQLRKEIDARVVLEKEKQYLADVLAEAREREHVLKEKLEDAEERAEHLQTQQDLARQEAYHTKKAHERAMYALGVGLGGRCL